MGSVRVRAQPWLCAPGLLLPQTPCTLMLGKIFFKYVFQWLSRRGRVHDLGSGIVAAATGGTCMGPSPVFVQAAAHSARLRRRFSAARGPRTRT